MTLSFAPDAIETWPLSRLQPYAKPVWRTARRRGRRRFWGRVSARRWLGRWRRDRSPASMAWCAGVWSIWWRGYTRSSGFQQAARPSAASRVRWGSGSSQCGHRHTDRTRRPWRPWGLSKKLPGRGGGDPRTGWPADRSLVPKPVRNSSSKSSPSATSAARSSSRRTCHSTNGPRSSDRNASPAPFSTD